MSERSDLPGGFCPVCGSPLTEGAQFCGACGSHVPSPLIPYDAPTTPDGIPSGSGSAAPTVPGISSLAVETGTRCVACGTVNRSDAEVCAVCGTPLLDDMTDSRWPSEPGHNGNQP